MSKALAISFADNYQNEFDIESLIIMTENEYAEYIKAINTASYPIHFPFGSNQEIIYNSPAEVISKLSIKPISDIHYNLLQEMNVTAVGHFPAAELFQQKGN